MQNIKSVKNYLKNIKFFKTIYNILKNLKLFTIYIYKILKVLKTIYKILKNLKLFTIYIYKILKVLKIYTNYLQFFLKCYGLSNEPDIQEDGAVPELLHVGNRFVVDYCAVRYQLRCIQSLLQILQAIRHRIPQLTLL